MYGLYVSNILNVSNVWNISNVSNISKLNFRSVFRYLIAGSLKFNHHFANQTPLFNSCFTRPIKLSYIRSILLFHFMYIQNLATFLKPSDVVHFCLKSTLGCNIAPLCSTSLCIYIYIYIYTHYYSFSVRLLQLHHVVTHRYPIYFLNFVTS